MRHYDAINSFGSLIFYFMKASSAVNYVYVHTDDGGVESLLFAVKRLTSAVCVLSQNAASSAQR